MGSVIVANSNKDSARRIGAVLKTDGVLVYGLCTTGAQLLEMTSYHYRGGVVVCTLDLQDVTAWDLPQMAPNYDFLFIIKPHQAEMAADLDSACLMTPLNKPDLTASVNMFLNLAQPGIPARRNFEEEQKELLQRAKQLLMERNYFTEAQAHRFLQKKSMDTGKRLIEIAAIVLEMF